MQVSEFFFWKVGYVYAKTDTSLRGMFQYFFSSFNLDYFKEFFRGFPWMSLIVLAGIFLCLGRLAGRGIGSGGADDDRTRSPWLYFFLALIFPLLFFGVFRTHVQPRYLAQLFPVFVFLFLVGWPRLSGTLVDLFVTPLLALKPKAKAVASALWLNNLEDLKKVVEGNAGRRVWLVGSTSLARRDHINQEISDYLATQKDKIVFRGWDGISEVYLWNDNAGVLTGGRHTFEGEWLPTRWGSIAYGEEFSKGAAILWEPGRRDELVAEIPGEFKAGRYRLRLRIKTGGGGGTAFAAAVVSAENRARLRSLTVPAGTGGWIEPEITFALREGDKPNFQVRVPGTSRVWIDYFDIVPEGSGR